MKLTQSIIERIIKEEITQEYSLDEELGGQNTEELRKFIRKEISLIFFDLFRKRSVWS